MTAPFHSPINTWCCLLDCGHPSGCRVVRHCTNLFSKSYLSALPLSNLLCAATKVNLLLFSSVRLLDIPKLCLCSLFEYVPWLDIFWRKRAWKLRAQIIRSTEGLWFPHSVDTCKFLLQTQPPYLSKYLSHTWCRWLSGPELWRCSRFLGENTMWT